MPELSSQDVQALGRAVNLEIQEPDLTQVAWNLNAILVGMEKVEIDGLNAVEPLPIIRPETKVGG